MTIRLKKEKLQEIYAEFETQASEYNAHAICKPGCAFCCTSVGNVDITTLEGSIIRDYISTISKKKKPKIKKKLLKNKQEKESSSLAQCPFLSMDNTCEIYDIRPFSCRQLYSLKNCLENNGPTIHKQSAELAKQTIKKLQQLDDTGYSGHIIYILLLLDKTKFRKFYLSGGFDPSQIMEFGKSHKILINSFISKK